MNGTQMIPNGTFIRILFDNEASYFLQKISDEIQQSTEGSFISQLDVRAGIGCPPFHIKLISSVEMTSLDWDSVHELLERTGEVYEAVQGHILPICSVTRTGLVSLKISCRECVEMGRHLAKYLPGANDTVSTIEENLSVSIGTFNGKFKAAFEDWLNKELAENSPVFPFFKGEYIELCEDQNGFFLGSLRDCRPVRFMGKPRARKSIVPLIEVDTPLPSPKVGTEGDRDIDGNSSGHDGSGDDDRAIHASASQEKESVGGLALIEQKLLASTLSNCKKLMQAHELFGHVVVLENNPAYDIIVPVDADLWKKHCASIFRMVDGMLKQVGPKVSENGETLPLSVPLCSLSSIRLYVVPFCFLPVPCKGKCHKIETARLTFACWMTFGYDSIFGRNSYWRWIP